MLFSNSKKKKVLWNVFAIIDSCQLDDYFSFSSIIKV